jgi:hypothetical protein
MSGIPYKDLTVQTDVASNDYVANEDISDTTQDASGSVKKSTWSALLTSLGVTLNTAVQTLTGKTLTSPKINEDVEVTATSTELNLLDGKTDLVPNSYINVKDYGAKGDNSTDDTTAITNAFAAITTNKNTVWFPAGKYRITSGFTTSYSGVRILGAGASPNGTQIITSQTTGDIFTLNSSIQRAGIQGIYISYSSLPTAGYAITITGNAYRCFAKDIIISHAFNGINVLSAVETELDRIELRYMIGSVGIKYAGALGALSHGLRIDNMLADNPYPASATTAMVKTWAISTAYSLNDIIYVNGKVYQCTTAGTSAGVGTGPSGVPGTTATNAFTTEIDDGTAKWKFVNSAMQWIVFDNYAYTLRLKGLSLLDGYTGVVMTDTANTGSSYPTWLYASQLELDHSFFVSALLNGGEGAYVTNSWIGSSLSESGVSVGANFRGEASITNTRVMGNARYGILFNGGQDYLVTGCEIGDNSQEGSGTYHGVVVAANIGKFSIVGNKIGDVIGTGGNPQGYGVIVLAGTSDNYYITGNVLDGNVTGRLLDAGTGTTKTVQGASTLSGYNMAIGTGTVATPTDSDTLYWGITGRVPQTTGGLQRVYIPKTGKIKSALMFWSAALGVAGSGENVSMYVRLNNSTDTLIQTVGNTSSEKTFQNSALNIAVTAGDYIEIKVVFPAWATNPTQVIMSGQVYIETLSD